VIRSAKRNPGRTWKTHRHQSYHKPRMDRECQLIPWTRHEKKLFSRFGVLRGGQIWAERKARNEGNSPYDKTAFIGIQSGDWLTQVKTIKRPILYSLAPLFPHHCDLGHWAGFVHVHGKVSWLSAFQGWCCQRAGAINHHLGRYHPPHLVSLRSQTVFLRIKFIF